MALRSARFRGIQRFERIHQEDTAAYFRTGNQGDEVRILQEALIDAGEAIPDGATGYFGQQSGAAVVSFKNRYGLRPNDAVAGQKTITTLDEKFSLPFADREEWLSWRKRPLQAWNFTRRNELNRREAGLAFTINPATNWLPWQFKTALIDGLTDILNPHGSPAGEFTPAASWGASPLDLYHCHVVVSADDIGTGAFIDLPMRNIALQNRGAALAAASTAAGHLEGSPGWTADFRARLLAPAFPNGRTIAEEGADILNQVLAVSAGQNRMIRLLWHSFETRRWRPRGIGSSDNRRSWWNQVSPALGPVTRAPFTAGGTSMTDAGWGSLGILAFVVDQFRQITVLPLPGVEAPAAIVGLDKAAILAAENLPEEP